jgi:hypothetical protein
MVHSLHVLNGEGDLTLTWDPKKPDEVANAREEVARLKKAGYTFFVVAGSPGKDEIEQGNGFLIVRRIDDPTAPEEDEVDLPPEPGDPLPPAPKLTRKQCAATTAAGKRCSRKAPPGEKFCGKHFKKPRTQAKPSPAPSKGRRHVAVRQMAGG